MNVLESVTIRSPNEIEEECAHFTITDTEQPFVLNDIAKIDEKYTFSAWVKGSGEISILGNKFPVTADWTKCVITFISESVNVEIYFRETGEYYLYNSQLEVGEKDTDYSPAPEDLEADAQSKADNALASAKTYADAQIKASADSVMIAVAQGYATVDAVSGVEKRVTDAEALIEVQAGLIEQKVDVDGVIAAINLSKGEARIAADKITLAGYTIADAFTCTNLTVAGDSTFSGVLNGATGSFSGEITANSGRIGSWNIENGVLSQTGISTVQIGDEYAIYFLRMYDVTSAEGLQDLFYVNFYGKAFANELEVGDMGATINSDLSVSGKIINEMTNDSGWKNATLGSNFSLYNSDRNVQYRKVGKIVHVRGEVKPTSDIAGGTTEYTIFTLPAGYRPSVTEWNIFQGSTRNRWLCKVSNTGSVTFSRYCTGSAYVTCATSHWLPFNFTFMID